MSEKTLDRPSITCLIINRTPWKKFVNPRIEMRTIKKRVRFTDPESSVPIIESTLRSQRSIKNHAFIGSVNFRTTSCHSTSDLDSDTSIQQSIEYEFSVFASIENPCSRVRVSPTYLRHLLWFTIRDVNFGLLLTNFL